MKFLKSLALMALFAAGLVLPANATLQYSNLYGAIKSIQRSSCGIADVSISNSCTATITSVNLTKAYVQPNGVNAGTGPQFVVYPVIVTLTNATTVTCQGGNSGGQSYGATCNFTVIEYN